MTEKTFDDLIKETPLHDLLSIPEIDLVKELMRQVREATIAECVEIIFDKWNNAIPVIRELPTDRITITDK